MSSTWQHEKLTWSCRQWWMTLTAFHIQLETHVTMYAILCIWRSIALITKNSQNNYLHNLPLQLQWPCCHPVCHVPLNSVSIAFCRRRCKRFVRNGSISLKMWPVTRDEYREEPDSQEFRISANCQEGLSLAGKCLFRLAVRCCSWFWFLLLFVLLLWFSQLWGWGGGLSLFVLGFWCFVLLFSLSLS